jgi:Nucleotidyltransferase domain
MRARRAAWSLASRTTGHRLPAAAARAYYHGVAGSLVRALERLDGVRAVYAWGTYATGEFVPGRSDVDLVVVLDERPPAAEADLLAEIRRPYARRQAVLPIDLTAIGVGELARDAGAHELIRLRAADARPGIALADWRLLGGDDVRPADAPPADRELRYLSDARVQAALAAVGDGGDPRAAAALLARLDEDAAPDAPDRAAIERLRAARRGGAVAEALHAALTLVDEHRRRMSVSGPRRPLALDAERAPGPGGDGAAQALLAQLDATAGAGVRSATLHRPLFAAGPALLLECGDAEAAGAVLRWAVAGGARDAARSGLRLEVLTTALAQDAWRSRALRWVSLAGGRHLAGDPLALRIAVPEGGERRVAHYGAVTAAALARWSALGRRGIARDDTIPLRLAAARAIAAGEDPPTGAADGPAAGASALDDREWTRLVLELWRAVPGPA